MSPEQEAAELVNKYYNLFSIDLENSISIYEAAKCALLAVNELMKECWDHREIDLQAGYDYWVSVEKEIRKYEGIY
jgi:hypothetical protein